MRRCAALLESTLHHPNHAHARRRGTTQWKTRTRRTSHGVAGVRDAVGMLIPEACLRRDKISADAFDHSIEQMSRDILYCEAFDTNASSRYGAGFDRREIRFQGKGADLRHFVEVATRAASAEKCSVAGLQQDRIPTNALAFIGGKHLSDQANASEEARKVKGTNAMLQRVLKHCGKTLPKSSQIVGAGAVAADSRNDSELSANSILNTPPMTEGKRRAKRRQRRIERMLRREGDVHPCVYQGGCAFHGSAVMCPFIQYPSTVCLAWLRHGRCDDYLNGCCPWLHGSVGNVSKREAVANGFFYGNRSVSIGNSGDDSDGCEAEMLRESCMWMSTLLQLFFDVLATTIEGAEVGVVKGMLTSALLQQHLEKVQRASLHSVNGNPTDILFHFDFARCVVSVEWDLAVSALMTERIDFSDAFVASMPDAFAEIGWMDEEKKANVNEGQQLHDIAEQRIRRVLTIFNGYLCEPDNHEGSGVKIALSAPLTRWLLQRLVDDYNQKNSVQCTRKTTHVTLQELFEEASMFLLRERLEMAGVGSTVKGSGLGGSPRWSVLLLLQLMVLLARISVSCVAFFSTESTESSFLFIKMLLLLETDYKFGFQGHSVQTRYVGCCVFLLSVLSKLALALVSDGVQMFAFARPALIDVTRRLAKNIEVYFARSLLRSSGWSAWTDEQMFAPQRLAGYTAADYARFHLPIIAHCFVASALNIFLLHVLNGASKRYHLRQSPVAAALFDSNTKLELHRELSRHEHFFFGDDSRHVRKGIQPYILEVLPILVSLQEENNAVLARRQQLVEEFMKRREECQERLDALTACRKNKSSDMNKSSKRSFVDNDEFHIFEKLLPYGSVMVSADIVGLLFRVLFEGGGAYKALRLATSAIHVSRMLRHAAKQPMSYVVQSEKMVYKRVRCQNTGKKRVILIRLPVLRRVDPEADRRERGSAGARPVALYMQLGEAAVAEVARIGVRMGAAGARLVRGVCTDCIRGLLVDYADGRCLPAPAAADVNSDGAVSAAFGSRVLQTVFSIAGVGGHSSSGGRQASQSPETVIRERRIPPTPLLLEVIMALTPSNNRDMHTQYERWCSMDPQLLVNYRVLLAQQYHNACHHFGRALYVAADVWLDFINTGNFVSLSRQSIAFLFKEKNLISVPTGFDDIEILSTPHNCHNRHEPPQSPPSKMLKDLRNYLTCSDDENGKRTVVSQRSTTHLSFVRLCFSAQFINFNALRRMRWAVFAGTLLALRYKNLTGTQCSCSCLLLRNAFIIAQQAPNFCERAQDIYATVRIFFLLDIMRPALCFSTAARQLPWCDNNIRDLPQVLAVQVWLAEQLQGYLATNKIFFETQRCMELLSGFKGLAKLHQYNVDQTNIKNLIMPFIQIPELGVKWLQESFFKLPDTLLLWIATHVDSKDIQALRALAAWSSFLYLNGTINVDLHKFIIKKSTKKNTEEEMKALKQWVDTNTQQ